MRYFSILGAGAVVPWADVSWTVEIPAAMKRRDPRIWHMAHVAALRAIAKSPKRPVSIATATALGALDETKNFLDGIYTDGFGSPKNFIASVHNGMAGKLALDFKIPGPNLTVCDGANSFASAIAACELLSPSDFPALVVAVDESIALLDRLRPHLPRECQSVVVDGKREGAIAFIISDMVSTACPRIGSTGSLFIGSADADEAFRKNIPERAADTRPITPKENGGGYIAAAIGAYECVTDGRAARRVIGSFSPSSKSIAMVDICR